MGTTCTIEQKHCENCGSTDLEDLQNSYSGCCNELIVQLLGTCRGHHVE